MLPNSNMFSRNTLDFPSVHCYFFSSVCTQNSPTMKEGIAILFWVWVKNKQADRQKKRKKETRKNKTNLHFKSNDSTLEAMGPVHS